MTWQVGYSWSNAAGGRCQRGKVRGPDSPVTVLTKGRVPVTAFIPNDWSFRKLAKGIRLSGRR